MLMELAEIYKYKVLNVKKILTYGFLDDGKCYIKEIPIMQNQFSLIVCIGYSGSVEYKVIENAFAEEYVLIHVSDAQGSFVDEVRRACEKEFKDIADKCFDVEDKRAGQTKRVMEFISSQIGVSPEYPWDKTPQNAIFRRDDNDKWFAVIMKLNKSKLDPLCKEMVDVINMKAAPEKVSELLEKDNYYPAFHMNKKHWFTVCLDGSVSDNELFELITSSFEVTGHKK